jgi:hypothetical protein
LKVKDDGWNDVCTPLAAWRLRPMQLSSSLQLCDIGANAVPVALQVLQSVFNASSVLGAAIIAL